MQPHYAKEGTPYGGQPKVFNGPPGVFLAGVGSVGWVL